MDFSTCPYCNSSSLSAGMPIAATPYCTKSAHTIVIAADKNQTNPKNKKAWAGELSGRVHFYGKTVDEFIDTLLPCSAPYTLDDDLKDAFKAYNPRPGREVEEYPNLVRITSLICLRLLL